MDLDDNDVFKARQQLIANLRARIAIVYPDMSVSAAYTHLSRMAGVPRSTMLRLMRGDANIALDELIALCTVLGCTVREITQGL